MAEEAERIDRVRRGFRLFVTWAGKEEGEGQGGADIVCFFAVA